MFQDGAAIEDFLRRSII